MFCPDGYISLYEISSAFDDFAFEWWASEGCDLQASEWKEDKKEFLSSGGDASKYIDRSPDVRTPFQALLFWGLSRLMHRHHAIFKVAAPDGKIMRLAQSAFEASRIYDGDFPKTMVGQKALIDHLQDGFFHFDRYSGTISPCSVPETVEAFDLSAEVQALLPFAGWSICWKPKDFTSWKSELRAILYDEIPPLQSQRYTVADEGRAASQIIGMFDADDQVTKAQCRGRLNVALGTLAFGRAWNLAKSKRPELGNGGRPKSKPQTETPV